MDEYNNQHTTPGNPDISPSYQGAGNGRTIQYDNTDNILRELISLEQVRGQNTDNMLSELLEIEREKTKQLRSIRSYCSVVALVAGLQLIFWVLSFFGIKIIF